MDRLAVLLAEDARFTMPPLPAWFDGREMVLRFIAERMFEMPWRLERRTVNGQPGFLCRMLVDGVWQLGAVNVIALPRRAGHAHRRPSSIRRSSKNLRENR